MTETNIRIVEQGADLKLEVRVCHLSGQDLSPKTFEQACDVLRSRGLAAVPSGGEILLLAPSLTTPVLLDDDANWKAEVRDSGKPPRVLDFSNPDDAPLMAQLLERRLLVVAARKPNWWKLDSARIWYESKPCEQKDGIAAYRRYELSSVVLDGVGIGLVVDIGTAFFTTSSVAEVFRTDIPKPAQEENRRRFDRLSQRQKEQKATLRYDCGKFRVKCYFDRANAGETCGTTGKVPAKGEVYPSLFAYYQARKPGLGVKEADPVARVSFKHLEGSVPVSSRLLFLRVMNAALPDSIADVDKIDPQGRRGLVQGFWNSLGDQPLGADLPKMQTGFWRPSSDRTGRCRFPGLLFGKGTVVAPPSNGEFQVNKDFFRNRLHLLRDHGCFNVPATVTRGIHLAVPSTLEVDMATDLAGTMSKMLSKWTRQNINVLSPQPYADLAAGIEELKAEARPGIALFVFEDSDPAAYYTVSNELKNWRVKRITVHQLESSHRAYIRFKDVKDEQGRPHRAVRNWRSFVEMCALDVLQRMDCVPYRPTAGMKYDAHLAIDVGHDRRYYAVSLLICRATDKHPHFGIDSVVEVKADAKKETINEVHLKNSIIKLFRKVKRGRFDPLTSLFIVRDGRECGHELEGIESAKLDLIKEGFLAPGVKVDLVDFHKESVKGVRLWDNAGGTIRNVMEGTYVLLGSRDAVLANTGCLTLNQGTAEPVMLSARTEGLVLGNALGDVHTSSHLNWSSPGRAQSLPLELKRTDEQLESRTAQEIKRIR